MAPRTNRSQPNGSTRLAGERGGKSTDIASVPTPRRSRIVVWGIVAAAAMLAALWISNLAGDSFSDGLRHTPPWTQLPFDGNRAQRMLETLCRIGPRISGSPGMAEQQAILTAYFQRWKGQVELQEFECRHPDTGERVPLANLIVRWHPDRPQRILVCTHYDTRPYCDRDPDPRKRRLPLVGANDGASGVAVLAELARHLNSWKSDVGIDFAFFDAEEFIFDETRDKNRYFLGSAHFARTHVARTDGGHYRAAILLDMVGDADLRIQQEGHSLRWAETKPIVQSVWRTARRIGVREFVFREGPIVRDDHLPLYEIARIPAIDLIDFDYPNPFRPSYWHTTNDTPDKCSAESLDKVGSVVLAWLQEQRSSPAP